MGDTLAFIIIFLLRAAALLFLLRFVLQLCRADFYNPLSMGIARATDPVLGPVRKVLGGWRNIDFASFAAAWLAHAVMLVVFIVQKELPMAALVILTDTLRATLSALIWIFLIAIFISIVMSWIAPHVVSPGTDLIRQVAEPVMAPARRIIPSIGGGLDLSPILTVLVLTVIQGPILSRLLPYGLWHLL